MSEEDGGEPSSPKKGVKPDYVFGYPKKQRLVFSDIAHLPPQFVSFARSLAEHALGDEDDNVVRKERAAYSPPSPKKHEVKVKTKHAPGDGRPGSSSSKLSAEEKANHEPCARPECRDIFQKILDIQIKNQIERDDMVRQSEEFIRECEDIEQECSKLEETARTIAHDGSTLEEHLQLLNEKLEKKERSLESQGRERDEWANKVASLEMERQRLARRAKEIEAALSEAMWGGKEKTNLTRDETPKYAYLTIKPPSAKSIRSGEVLNQSVSYNSLVRTEVLDFTERPKSVKRVPHHLLSSSSAVSLAPLSRKSRITDFEVFADDSSYMSGLPFSPMSSKGHGGHLPSVVGLDDDRTVRSRRSRGRHSDNGTHASTTSSWTHLDPVLYKERARTSWGRNEKLGKVRERQDPPGFRRAMLTSTGHPGIFDAAGDDLDDASHPFSTNS